MVFRRCCSDETALSARAAATRRRFESHDDIGSRHALDGFLIGYLECIRFTRPPRIDHEIAAGAARRWDKESIVSKPRDEPADFLAHLHVVGE